MPPIKIGKYEIIDSNGNDRFDAGEAYSSPLYREWGKPAVKTKLNDPETKRFIEASGLDFNKFQANPLSGTKVFVDLLKDADGYLPVDFRLLTREAERVGYDLAPLLERLENYHRGQYSADIDNAEIQAEAGSVGGTKAFLKNAQDRAEALLEHFNARIERHNANLDRILNNAYAKDFEKTLSKLEDLTYLRPGHYLYRDEIGDTNESKQAFFRANLARIEAYGLKSDAPFDWTRFDALQKYANIEKYVTSGASEAKALLEAYFHTNRLLKDAWLFNASDAEKLYSDAYATEFRLSAFYNLEVHAIPNKAEVFAKKLEKQLAEIEKLVSLGRATSWDVEKELERIVQSAAEYGIHNAQDRADQVRETLRLSPLEAAYQRAESYAMVGELESAREALNSAWELASELNVDFNTKREENILRQAEDTHFIYGISNRLQSFKLPKYQGDLLSRLNFRDDSKGQRCIDGRDAASNNRRVAPGSSFQYRQWGSK